MYTGTIKYAIECIQEYVPRFEMDYDHKDRLFTISQKSFFGFVDTLSLLGIYAELNYIKLERFGFIYNPYELSKLDIKDHRRNVKMLSAGAIGQIHYIIATKLGLKPDNVANINYYKNVIEYSEQAMVEVMYLCGCILHRYDFIMEEAYEFYRA
jgi:hypothetical protein